MNPPPSAHTAPASAGKKAQTDRLRQWLAIEQSDRMVAFAQTALGKLSLYGLAYLAAWLTFRISSTLLA